MKRHCSTAHVAPEDCGAVVAIGNFDGVHLGHQSVIALARAAAANIDAPLGVVTFEPHPREYFQPTGQEFRLMTADIRARRMSKLGVEQLYELPFDKDLAALTAEEFVRTVLVERLAIRHLVAGADFRFGKDRTGDAALLQEMGNTCGFGVTIAPLISNEDGDYSSTAIRNALTAGKPDIAQRILGHWHRIEGEVQHGDKRGRDLGFPTINLSLSGLHKPCFGVYSVVVDVLSGPHAGTWAGAASLGARPTFGENRPNLEVHLLDFSGDLYGAVVSVALIAWQRPELRFDNIDDLIDQMHRDVEIARAGAAPYLP